MKIHRIPRSLPGLRCALLVGALLPFTLLRAAPPADSLFGRGALAIPGGGAGWLELRQEEGWYDGSILWGGGSVLPLSNVVVADGTATLTRACDVTRKDAAGRVIRTRQLTETVTINGKVSADLPNDPGRTKGRIALQLHGAKDCDFWFKDIAIQTH